MRLQRVGRGRTEPPLYFVHDVRGRYGMRCIVGRRRSSPAEHSRKRFQTIDSSVCMWVWCRGSSTLGPRQSHPTHGAFIGAAQMPVPAAACRAAARRQRREAQRRELMHCRELACAGQGACQGLQQHASDRRGRTVEAATPAEDVWTSRGSYSRRSGRATRARDFSSTTVLSFRVVGSYRSVLLHGSTHLAGPAPHGLGTPRRRCPNTAQRTPTDTN